VTNRLPVLPPVTPETFSDYVIYYQDRDKDGNLGAERERETLSLVSEMTAKKIAGAWQSATWVRGRVYGYRKVETPK
jgi:hypothetical protein